MSKPKPYRRADGKIEWFIRPRIRVPGETEDDRPRISLGVGLSQKRAEEKANAWYERREEMVAAYLAAKVTAQPSKAVSGTTNVVTLRKLGEQWTSGELLRRYGRVYGLKEKKSAKQDAKRLGRCYDVHTRGEGGPVFGDLVVADVREQ